MARASVKPTSSGSAWRGRRLDETSPGTGLGLGIVREIVSLYNGSISFGSASAGGLQVSVGLPLADQPAEAAPPVSQIS